MTPIEFHAAIKSIERAKAVAAQARKREQPVPEDIRTILRAEFIANRAASEKTPDDWQRDIGRICPVLLRSRVAGFVWWDHFGSRSATERWAHLDEWMDSEQPDDEPVTREQMEIGLVLAGYTPSRAKRRLAGGWSGGAA